MKKLKLESILNIEIYRKINMFPFKNKNNQIIWSIFFIVLGVLIMIIKPLSNFVDSLGLNAFITGLIIAFIGFFYFMDVQ